MHSRSSHTTQLPTLPPWANATVERQLTKEFPNYPITSAMKVVNSQYRAEFDELHARREARRAALSALPLTDLQTLHGQHDAQNQKYQNEQAQRDLERKQARRFLAIAAEQVHDVRPDPRSGSQTKQRLARKCRPFCYPTGLTFCACHDSDQASHRRH